MAILAVVEQSVESVKGIGEAVAKLLKKLGVLTVRDLLEYFPRKYDDYSQITGIASLKPGTVCTRGTISSVKGRYVRRGMHVTEAILSDETGSVRLVWFNQPYRENSLKKTQEYFVIGEFGLHYQRMSIMSPSVELVSDFPISSGRIVPTYRETKGLSSRQLRTYITRAFEQLNHELSEYMPGAILKQQKLMSYQDALWAMHFPNDIEHVSQAKRRLGFDELFVLTTASFLNKQELQGEHALAVPFKQKLAKDFVHDLPFELTNAQRKVVWQMYLDMQRDQPMNRLLEGDVGSGKTVVAAMAAVMVMEAGYQVALMAPTEILARQHAETVFELLKPHNLAQKVGLLLGSTKPKAKIDIKNRIASGEIQFIIGTHALIQDDVITKKLGLVVIDEQHRFGVEQRKALQAKAGHMPHVLHMTATPIPRSLALTVYGELDISLLDVLPTGRKKIQTKLVSPNSLKQMYDAIDDQVARGRQVFWVCPLISESEASSSRSAEKVYDTLRKEAFKHRRIGLLHGRMKPSEKETVMQQMLRGDYDILVSTTVIEVGVNVPNASVMVVENADRFGLAQLHQLRGRVGRSDLQSYCYLIQSDSKAASNRLRFMTQSSDGFVLAEYDLELRGPGAIYGQAQHGALDLKVANITDTRLIAEARASARKFLDSSENLLDYTELYKRIVAARAITNLN